MDENVREKLLALGVRRLGRKLLDKLQAAYADMRPESLFALTALAYWKKLEELHILSAETASKRISDPDTMQYLTDFSVRYASTVAETAHEFTIEELQTVLLFWENRHRGVGIVDDIPLGAAQLALRLLKLEDGDTLLNLGAGRGIFLREAAFLNKSIHLIGLEQDRSMCRILHICSGCMGWGIEIHEGNVLDVGKEVLSSNKIFVDAAYEPSGAGTEDMRQRIADHPMFHQFKTKHSAATAWHFIYAALREQQEGRTVVLLRDRLELTRAETEIFRKKLIQEGRIEAVIALPEDLDYARAPHYLLVFSRNNESVRLLDASEIYTSAQDEPPKKRATLGFHPQRTFKEKDMDVILQALKEDGSRSRSFSCEELIARGSKLLPDSDFLDNDDYCMNLTGMPTIKDICRIYRGEIFANTKTLESFFSETPTDSQYLQLKDVQDGLIEGPFRYLRQMDEKKYRSWAENDMLIMGKNAPLRIGLLQVPEDTQVLFGGNIYAMKVDKEKCDPIYLMLYLQSEDGTRQLEHILCGRTAMKTISLRDLENVRIPMIPMAEQRAIAKKYRKLHTDLTKVLDKAEQISTSIRQLVVQHEQ